MKRVPSAELLDTDSGTTLEIDASLRDLDHINRWFGGIRTSQSLVTEVARTARLHRMSMLEVAAGSGTTVRAVRDRLEHRGIRVNLTLLDRAASHMVSGRQNGHANSTPLKSFVVGDALKLPFQNASFDVVGCNLFVHHLNPEQVMQFLGEALRVCRHAVVINDVSRSWLHLGFVYAGLPLFRSRITWNDAPASVRQAYTLEEIQEMVKLSSAAHVEIRNHYLFRIGVIAWKSHPKS